MAGVHISDAVKPLKRERHLTHIALMFKLIGCMTGGLSCGQAYEAMSTILEPTFDLDQDSVTDE